MIEWSFAADYLENEKGDIDPHEAKEWLEDHKHIIDWEQFEEWAKQVQGTEGYEWLDEVFQMWEA